MLKTTHSWVIEFEEIELVPGSIILASFCIVKRYCSTSEYITLKEK